MHELAGETELYAGLTVRLDDQEVNVHFVDEDWVYYARYVGQAMFYPNSFIGAYRMKREDFREALRKAMRDGAIVYSLVDRDCTCN